LDILEVVTAWSDSSPVNGEVFSADFRNYLILLAVTSWRFDTPAVEEVTWDAISIRVRSTDRTT